MYVLLALREHVSNSVYMWQSMISWFVLWLALKHVGGIHWITYPSLAFCREANVYAEEVLVKVGYSMWKSIRIPWESVAVLISILYHVMVIQVANTRLDIIPFYADNDFPALWLAVFMATNYAMLSSGIPRNIPWITYMLLVCTRVDTREN